LVADTTETDYDDGGIGNGTTHYYRVRSQMPDGNVSDYGIDGDGETYAWGTTWDIPDAQDLVSATTPNPSMIRITRNGTYPDGNGEAVDTWEVWRCDTPAGVYVELDAGLTATTYDDLTVKTGETWYYKAKFTNLVGDSALSTNYVSTTVTLGYRLYHPSNLRINAIQDISLPSQLRVIERHEIYYPSNLRVYMVQQISLSSDLRVKAIGQQISLSSSLVVQTTSQLFQPSNLRINITQEQTLSSNLRVKAIGQQISLSSNLVIQLTSHLSVSSSLRVLIQQQLSLSSNLAVRVFGQQIYLPSSLSVQIEWRAAFTPTVTFSRYELNDSTEPTIDDDIDFGSWEGTKTMTAIAVDPYEESMVNPDNHEMYYTVDPESGHENFYQVPLTNGLLSIDDATSGTVYEVGYRGIGFDQQTWTSGSTTIEVEININDGLSGNRVNLTGTWANTGTVWSPPSASGTDVLDVPSVYNGCCMVVVQPSDWDGNTDHKLHDWLPLQVSVGHAVEVKDYAEFYSGTHEDSEINLQGYINANGSPYDISFKVYHERPNEWEWYSGATKIDSGTLTTNKDTWQMLDNLNMGATHTSGTTTFSLKLYARSGSVLHPNPVRVMTVNRII